MKADSQHWNVMGPPATPEEAAALDAFREALNDDGRTTAWVNLTFIDLNGRTGEIDVLLLTPVGLFCVELKGWHGTITGDSQRWYQNGRTHPNPFLVTDRKSKRLASLLESYTTNQQMRSNLPWVNSLVVLHGEGSTFAPDQSGRHGVIKLDGYGVASKPALQRLSDFLATPPMNPRDSIDPQRAKLVRRLCEKASFLPTPKTRMVGDYAVAESDPVAEGVDWQDVIVAHPSMPKIKQRLRLYDVPPKASASERKRIEQLAQREFQLTYGIKHEGIAVPQQHLNTNDGPAMLFPYEDTEKPLDAFLADDGASLTLDSRVAMVEQLGEILRYAHNRHLHHRALSPQRVWVRTGADGPRLEVRDWYSAQKDRGGATTTSWTVISRGVTDLVGVAGHEELVWLAPEARQSVTDVPGAPLDVFGFGALTFLILTGKAPASSIAEVQEIQQRDGSFDPRTVTGELPDVLAAIVSDLTVIEETERPASIEDALLMVRMAWDEVRASDKDAPRVEVADPLDAQSGDMVGPRFLVTSKRGEGSSGVALAVLDDDDANNREYVLKIARDEAAGRRLASEAEVLAGLDHPRVVRLLETVELGGRPALLMSDAGKETLSTKLAKEGQLTLEQLQRWGSDLLGAMAYVVDVKGLFHRDIKPANLGIVPESATHKPRLILFDFSLAREPLDRTSSGTQGYLDPYLGVGRRIGYDRAAELWAIAVTLFEMATGVLPWWSNGASIPASPTDRPVVEPTSFDPAAAESLVAFFQKALAPDLKDRFGNVEDMLHDWSEAFASLVLDEDARKRDDALAACATLDTSLEESGLSAQALSALRRLSGVVTVGDILGVHPVSINSIRGLGETYRKEIQARIRQWRTALRPSVPVPGAAPAPGINRLVNSLLDSLSAEDRPLTRDLLGLGEGPLWPSTAEVAATHGATREGITAMIDTAAAAWSKIPAFLDARIDLLSVLEDAGRVMTIPEAVTTLVILRGSTLDADARARYGTALVRAIVEFDARDDGRVLTVRRRVGERPYLLALGEGSAWSDDGAAAPSADLLTDIAGELGAAADELVVGGVVTSSTAIRLLRGVIDELDSAEPWQVSDARLLRLAAAASQGAAVSGFQELYPKDLPITKALELAMRGKPGRSIDPTAIRRTVEARFPQLTEPLPARMDQLDGLMRGLFPDLVRREGVYQPKSTALFSTGTASTTQFAPTPVAEITRTLTDSLERNSALTLTVPPRRYTAAARELAETFGVDVLDIAELVVTATKGRIEAAGGMWAGLLGYDALDRGSKQWKSLESVVQQSIEPVWEERLSTTRPLLLTNAGPLVRYGMTSLLAALLDTGTKRPAARWLLVAKPGEARAPLLENSSVPLGPSGWIDLPRDFAQLTNAQQAVPQSITGGNE